MLEIQTTIGLLFRIAAALVMIFLVLPRIWREAQVYDGLGRLRKLIFFASVVFSAANILLIGINVGRTSGLIHWNSTGAASVINGASELILSIILYLIYHYDYGRTRK